MKLHRIKLSLEKGQYETLLQMAKDEKRSVSEIVRNMMSRQLRDRHRCRMILAAQNLLMDYRTDPALTDFTALDGEEFLI